MKIDKLIAKLDNFDVDVDEAFNSINRNDYQFLFLATVLVEMLREIKKLKV